MADRMAATSEQVTHRTSWAFFAINLVIVIITAPYRRTFKLYTWRPLKAIRAAEGNRRELMALAKDFKSDKYAELQSVQVAVCYTIALPLCDIDTARPRSVPALHSLRSPGLEIKMVAGSPMPCGSAPSAAPSGPSSPRSRPNPSWTTCPIPI